MRKPPSPSPLRGDTSPPVPGGEDGRSAAPPSSPSRSGGEVSSRRRDGEGELPAGSRRKSGATAYARRMRRDGTKEEALLWIELKGRRLGGYHFVRQFPIGPDIVDFCCRKRKLIVEVDGSQHADSGRDRRRDEYLRDHGWSTLRVWNEDVLRRRTAVCDTILAAPDGRLSESVSAADLRFTFAGSRP
ncbi:MAG: DUF559 domain-containing protein [Rhizobiaceae bacterium]|nr:DUF559 domain-containing protein [Rhizobiaceae bacterium]MCV0405568.1 DUF559 domain-containing protein [Rhizobiaceae bacterium]